MSRKAALIIFVFLVFTTTFFARVNEANAGPALVFDPKNNLVLYSEDPDMLWHPASLTKLMTAYLTFEALKAGKISLETKLVSSENSYKQPPSKIGLPLGGQMSVELGLHALIVKSANDVAVMLAEKVAGSEPAFVAKMNETARRLGMSKTRFYNPNGLPDARQVTTARDLAYLARALLKDFPDQAHLFSMPKVRIGKRNLRSHNDLLRTFDGADGMKTGFICASGFNVVASATRDSRKLVAVVLGAPSSKSRRARATQLLEHGFHNYLWKSLLLPANLQTHAADDASAAKGPKNMRRHVTSWSCGNRPRRARRVKKRRKKIRKKHRKKAAVKRKAS